MLGTYFHIIRHFLAFFKKTALQVLIEQNRQSPYPISLHKFKNHASW